MTSVAELEARAKSLSQRGDSQATMLVCQDILAIDSNHLPSLRSLADLAMNSGDFSSATNHLTTLRKNSPENLQVLTQLGQALYRQGVNLLDEQRDDQGKQGHRGNGDSGR